MASETPSQHQFMFDILPNVKDGDSEGIEQVKQIIKKNPSWLYCHGQHIIRFRNDPDTVLHNTQSLELTKFFVGMDASLAGRSVRGVLPIHKAIEFGRLPIVKFLIGHQPELMRIVHSPPRDTLMMSACYYCQLEVMKYLFKIDPSTLDYRRTFLGHNLLHFHSNSLLKNPGWSIDIVKWILRERPHFAFETDHENNTPLSLATEIRPGAPATLFLECYCQIHEVFEAIDEVVGDSDAPVPSSEHENLVVSVLTVVAEVLRNDIDNVVELIFSLDL